MGAEFGLDIAKSCFQLHCVDPSTGEIKRFKLKREQVLDFFAKHSSVLVPHSTSATQYATCRLISIWIHWFYSGANSFVKQPKKAEHGANNKFCYQR